jgi:hypothetical protein
MDVGNRAIPSARPGYFLSATITEEPMTDQRDDPLPDLGGDLLESEPAPERRGRVRMALVAGATATAAIVVGTVIAVVSAPGGSVAAPGNTATTTGPSSASTAPGSAAVGIPSGWEQRTYQGMTFAVPPHARKADGVGGNPQTFSWNGPRLGHDKAYASVIVTVRDRHGDIPQDVDRGVTVPGAVAVRTGIGPAQLVLDDPDDTFEVTSGTFQLFTARSVVVFGVQFAGGPEGEQMARDLLASVDLTGLEASPPS